MTIKFVFALPLILLTSSLPAHALTKQEILKQEQQAFLNPQPPTAPNSLETEQAHFLKAKLPVVTKSQPQTEIGYSPSVVTPVPTAPPQIGFALPLSLDGLLHRETEHLLYPLGHPVAITSPFGWRTHPIFGGARFHAGTDLGAPVGMPVLATFTGTVISADWMGGYGKAIVLQHGSGLRSLYGHLSKTMVRPGQTIMQGTVIGLSGSTGNSTGPHLHFEMQRLTGSKWVAVDPGIDLKAAQLKLASAMQQVTRSQVRQ